MDTWLDVVLDAVKTAAGYEPCVNGGNINRPLTYAIIGVTPNQFRLEVIVGDKDISRCLSISKSIDDAIVDFYDYPKFPEYCSIEKNSSGLYSVEANAHTGTINYYANYYDIYVYDYVAVSS